MSDQIELQIPECAFLLKRETVLEWQLHGLKEDSGYQRISWEITSTGTLSKISVAEPGGSPFSAEVDFRNRKIIFFRGEMSDGKFTEVLSYLFGQVHLQVGPEEMHFITLSKTTGKKHSK